MNNALLLEELLGLLKTLNETMGVPTDSGESIKDRNVLKTESSDPNKRIKRLSSAERIRTTEIATLFAKAFFEYKKKVVPDTALETSIKKITPPPLPSREDISKKPRGSVLGGILALLGGAGALLLGLLTDGPFKGALKMLSKIGITGGIKLLVNAAKGFISTLSRFITAPFRMVGKLFSGGILKRILPALKPLTAVLRRIHLIGSIISIGFAISRFRNNDNVGGVIDVVSALAGLLYLVPGGAFVAFPLTMGLDMLNAWLDYKTAGAEDKQGAKIDLLKEMGVRIGKWFWDNADHFPILGGIRRFGLSWEAFKSGNIKEGLQQMGWGVLGLTGMGPMVHGIRALLGFFGDKKEIEGDLSPDTSWYSRFREWIKSKLKDLPYVLRKPLEWFGILDEQGDATPMLGSIQNVASKGLEGVSKFSESIWESTKSGFSWIGEKTKNALPSIKSVVGGAWDMATDNAVKTFQWVGDGIGSIVSMASGILPSILDKIKSNIEKFGDIINNLISRVGSMISGLFSFGGDNSKQAERESKARRAGHSSWGEYKQSGWAWKAENKTTPIITPTPKSAEAINHLAKIEMEQLKQLTNITTILMSISKKFPGMSGGASVSVNAPQIPSNGGSNLIPMEISRSDYGSSPYSLA